MALSPCCIPAKLIGEARAVKLTLNRLGSSRGQLSGDVPFEVGDRVQLELNRPTDGVRVRVDVTISSVRREGQQWGWLPAIHVGFEQGIEDWPPVGDDEHEEMVIEESSSYSDDDGSRDDQPIGFDPRDAPSVDLPIAPATASWSGEIETLDTPVVEPDVRTLDDILPMAAREANRTAQQYRAATFEVSSPPWERQQNTAAPQPITEVPRQITEVPPVEPAAEPMVPAAPRPDATESLREGLDTHTTLGTPRRDSAITPWSIPPGTPPDVVTREARILSEVMVSYLSAGRKRFGTAHDFSQHGLFLAVKSGDVVPPVGAVLRVGFPIETPRNLFVIRMTAEVRWAHGGDQADAAGRGVGLQVCAFDTATEHQFYEEYVKSLVEDTPGPRPPGPNAGT